MWGTLIQVGIWAGLYVANYLLRPKPQKPKPLTRDNLTLPRSEESTPVPLVFGRTRVTAPILAWAGPLKSKTNAVGGGYAITYGVNMLFVVGIPMTGATSRFNILNAKTPKLYTVWYGDKKMPMDHGLPSSGGNGANIIRGQNVLRPDFLGGLGSGGGLIGAYEWHWGSPDQDLSAFGAIGALMADANAPHAMADIIPGYRNQMLVGFTHEMFGIPGYAVDAGVVPGGTYPFAFTIGENASVDGISMEVGTYGNMDATVTTMTQPGYDFGGDADPAEVIYDMLTGTWGKIGLDPALVDKPSFLAASTVLKAEGHGYSNVHYDLEDGVRIISDVLQQIDAALYEEPTTGKLTLKLIRADYNPATIPHFTVDNVVEVEDYGIGSWKESVNEVRVNYTDRSANYKTGTAVAQSLANATVNANRRRMHIVDYPGISNATIAAKVAGREMNVLSRPLRKISVVLNRDAYALRPGSCFKLTFPEYNINAVIFRCQRVDVGQLFDNKVVLDAVEDAFASTYVAMPLEWGVIPFAIPFPITDQVVTETPYLLATLAKNIGVINDQNVPRLLGLGPASLNAARYTMTSREQPIVSGTATSSTRVVGPGDDSLLGQYQPDVPLTDFPTSFIVKTDYSRNLEPYDTTTGLETMSYEDPNRDFTDIEDGLTLLDAPVAAIQTQGTNLVLIVTPSGDMEFMAFEHCATMAGDELRFEKVWRGLFDTPAIDIPAGSRGFFVQANNVGRRGYAKGKVANFEMAGHAGFIGGSGDDQRGAITIRARPWLPAPVHDLRIAGESATGTTGLPAVAGHYKTVTRLDEGFDIYGRTRLRQAGLVVRGDAADQANIDFSATTYLPNATKAGVAGSNPQGYGILSTATGALTDQAGALAGACYLDGHGELDVEMRSQRVLAAGDPTIGLAGLALGDTLQSWDHPSIRVTAPVWRNLIPNPRFTYASTPWWTLTNMTVQTGTTSVSRNAGGRYIQGNSASAGRSRCDVPVNNYLPRGMTAVAFGWFRNITDTNDTRQLTVDALDGASASLLSASTAAAATATTNWQYTEVSLTCPANTAKIRWQADFVEVAAGGGTANVDTAQGEAGIRVGQIHNNVLTLLGNASFETAAMASWTVSAGNFTQPTAIASPSNTYARGGTAATNTAFQEFTLPAGFECGATALVHAWRAQVVAGDAGTVLVQAMDGASTVLASATTGSEQMTNLNEWYRRVLACDVPDGSTKIRVTITALKTTAADSGACFDDVHLSLHKKIEPAFEQSLALSSSAQPQPRTWQEFMRDFHTAFRDVGYDEAIPPSYVFAPGSEMSVGFSQQHDSGRLLEWSDNVTHTAAPMPGHFSGNAVDAFRFTRQSGASAACIEARDQAIDWIGSYDSTRSFSAVVFFRVDELTWAGVAAGLCGRRDLTAGWGLQIASGGTLEAVIEGTGGTKTATVVGTVVDGAVHMAVISYNADTDELTCFSERGPGVAVSTAVGLGEFQRVGFETCRFRIGRSSNSVDSLPGLISRVYLFSDVALGANDVDAMWTYAINPTGLGSAVAYSRSRACWVQGSRDSAGEFTLVNYASDQWARCSEGSFGGVALTKGTTNRIPSWDFAGASWVKDAGATLVQGALDPTGKLAGVTVTADAANGLKVVGLTGTATTTMRLVFWAKASVSSGVTIELMNASDVVKNTQTCTVGTTWGRQIVSFTGWDNSTPTIRIRWKSTAGTVTFTLAHVIWAEEGTEVPPMYPPPTTTVGAASFTWTKTFPRQINSEGEIEIVGKMLTTAPPANCTLVNLMNLANNNNRRELSGNTSGQAILHHWDATVPTDVTSTGTAFNWTQPSSADPSIAGWRLRGRWCRAKMLDATANAFAGVVSDCDVQSSNYGRVATFSESSAQDAVLQVNVAGTNQPTNWILSEIVVRAREEKLP